MTIAIKVSSFWDPRDPTLTDAAAALDRHTTLGDRKGDGVVSALETTHPYAVSDQDLGIPSEVRARFPDIRKLLGIVTPPSAPPAEGLAVRPEDIGPTIRRVRPERLPFEELPEAVRALAERMATAARSIDVYIPRMPRAQPLQRETGVLTRATLEHFLSSDTQRVFREQNREALDVLKGRFAGTTVVEAAPPVVEKRAASFSSGGMAFVRIENPVQPNGTRRYSLVLREKPGRLVTIDWPGWSSNRTPEGVEARRALAMQGRTLSRQLERVPPSGELVVPLIGHEPVMAVYDEAFNMIASARFVVRIPPPDFST